MQLDCKLKDFRIKPGAKVDLKASPTDIAPLYKSKEQYEKLMEEFRKDIAHLQTLLYAHDRYSLLLIFQGMDTAGKGGAIKHVMSGVNPQGCQVFSFGPPSTEELDHDFMWRSLCRLPERGRIGIFDRSYYEEVLVVRVHHEILAKQKIPREFADPDSLWRNRFQDIVNIETFLHRNGTQIVKFFLHLSREEQRKRLITRIDDPDKNWKFSLGDLTSRAHWNDYQHAFEECLEHTSTKESPWYLIPADDKQNARLIISHIICETLQSLPLQFPRATPEHLAELEQAKRLLQQEKDN